MRGGNAAVAGERVILIVFSIWPLWPRCRRTLGPATAAAVGDGGTAAGIGAAAGPDAIGSNGMAAGARQRRGGHEVAIEELDELLVEQPEFGAGVPPVLLKDRREVPALQLAQAPIIVPVRWRPRLHITSSR